MKPHNEKPVSGRIINDLRRCSALLGCLACVIGLSYGLKTVAAEPNDQRLSKIFADWDKRRGQVQAVKYFVSGEQTIPKGSTLNPQTNKPAQPPQPDQDKKVRKKLMLLLDFVKNRHRLESDCEEFNRYLPPDHAVSKEAHASLFDGTSLKSLNEWDKNSFKPKGRGPVADLAILRGYVGNYSGFNHYTFPLFLGHGVFGRALPGGGDYYPGHLKAKPDPKVFSVHGEGMLEGRSCLVLEVEAKTGSFSIWVDPKRDSAVVRFLEKMDDKVSQDLRMSYQETAEGWLPEHWTWKRFHYYLDESLESSEEMRVDKVVLEPSLADSDFTFAEKPGMLVLENAQSKPAVPHGAATITEKQWFRIDSRGKRSEVAFPTENEEDHRSLLVVLAMVATLLLILFPAVARIRETAHQLRCQNNLKQIGVAASGGAPGNLIAHRNRQAQRHHCDHRQNRRGIETRAGAQGESVTGQAMRMTSVAAILLSMVLCEPGSGSEPTIVFSGERKRNNLVSELLDVSSISKASSFSFKRSSDGWIFLSANCKGKGRARISLDKSARSDLVVIHDGETAKLAEAMRYVAKGEHQVHVKCEGGISVEKLIAKAIPELIHCGLGFDPAIKSYGVYDMDFLKKDVLPNVTTLIVPHNIKLSQAVIDSWHRQGRRFVAEVGINAQSKTADEHFKYWTGFLDKAPFLDGIIINEFGMNKASRRPSPERQKRAQQRHQFYEDAFTRMRADDRYKNKVVYAYFGGSANLVNYEDTGTTFVRALIDRDYRIALERYIFERSSEKVSKDALQAFIDGIADWEAKEPGVKKHMVIAFGLFSMPPGGINKLPNVDYHVWMDQQMSIVANHPTMADMAGLEWWTSILADEETVRFVGKLYRHYAIEGNTKMLTRDPLFLTHIQNADFEKGLEGWTLRPAEEGTIQAKSFPRYGRIEGRYMGLGRPADPEHIGDTFLWMKRSDKGPNTFSQTIKNLEPGRLYSMKMFSCDYQDLVNPKKKTMEEANKFIGDVVLEGVDVDVKKSFREMYASNPEPRIPVWITYHWTVFRAKGTTAKVIVSDWPKERTPTFGQEQIFNFLEIQPYHE